MGQDGFDVIGEQWVRERPDLDLQAMGVLARLWHAADRLGAEVSQVFDRHDLRRGEFDVLAALRRAGAPYTLIPSELADTLMMSRAGMTNRLDRLEEAGLVERKLDPEDRRSFLIALTPKGLDVIDQTMTEHAANLQRLVSGLTAQEQQTRDKTLRKLLNSL